MQRRVLYIIAQQDFRDEELFIPKKLLEDNKVEVVVASLSTKPAVSKLGKQVNPDIAIKDVDTDDYDMFIMAGGPGALELGVYDEVRDLFIEVREKDLPFGAICIAPKVLADFGVLEDKRATVFTDDDAIESLKDGGATYTGTDVEIDGQVVTANGPLAADKFGRAILEILKKIKD
jgi:protease I